MRDMIDREPRASSEGATVDGGQEAVDPQTADQARRAHWERANEDRVREPIELMRARPLRIEGRSDLSTTHRPNPPSTHAAGRLSGGGRKIAAGPKA